MKRFLKLLWEAILSSFEIDELTDIDLNDPDLNQGHSCG